MTVEFVQLEAEFTVADMKKAAEKGWDELEDLYRADTGKDMSPKMRELLRGMFFAGYQQGLRWMSSQWDAANELLRQKALLAGEESAGSA